VEEILDAVTDLLRNANLGIVVHWGDPMLNPQWNLPYVSVAPNGESEEAWTLGQTGGRNRVHTSINAFVAVSANANFTSVDLDSAVDRDLVQKVESVKAVLRANITLDGRVLTYRSLGVQYRSGIRGGEGIRVAQLSASYESSRSR
jgi:hypothetical protein